jgi:hypothetical protein
MTRSKKAARASRTRIMGLAAAMLAATTGIACAQVPYPSRADQIYGANANPKPQLAPSRRDRALFHRSGTRGRQGWVPVPCTPKVQAT